jgi:aliphatic nitrilase
VDEQMIRMLRAGPEAEGFLRSPDCCGGSAIVAPNSRILAGPMGAEEGILYAECDIEIGIRAKLRHDFAGHYNRPDVFRLEINRGLPKIYNVYGTQEPTTLATPAQERLPGAPRAIAAASAGKWSAVEMPRVEELPEDGTKP